MESWQKRHSNEVGAKMTPKLPTISNHGNPNMVIDSVHSAARFKRKNLAYDAIISQYIRSWHNGRYHIGCILLKDDCTLICAKAITSTHIHSRMNSCGKATTLAHISSRKYICAEATTSTLVDWLYVCAKEITLTHIRCRMYNCAKAITSTHISSGLYVWAKATTSTYISSRMYICATVIISKPISGTPCFQPLLFEDKLSAEKNLRMY